jgi:hypothetical protein
MRVKRRAPSRLCSSKATRVIKSARNMAERPVIRRTWEKRGADRSGAEAPCSRPARGRSIRADSGGSPAQPQRAQRSQPMPWLDCASREAPHRGQRYTTVDVLLSVAKARALSLGVASKDSETLTDSWPRPLRPAIVIIPKAGAPATEICFQRSASFARPGADVRWSSLPRSGRMYERGTGRGAQPR